MERGLILPGQGVGTGEFSAALFLDVDPERFVDGLDVQVSVPGPVIQIVGGARLARGAMLLAVPPEMAAHLREHIRQATVPPPPGTVTPN